jgi:hypothetical protein
MRMDAKMENTMKRSARVTALALNLHKPGLMQELIDALSGVKNDVPLLTAAREAVAQSWPQKPGPRPRKRPSGPEDILQTERGP